MRYFSFLFVFKEFSKAAPCGCDITESSREKKLEFTAKIARENVFWFIFIAFFQLYFFLLWCHGHVLVFVVFKSYSLHSCSLFFLFFCVFFLFHLVLLLRKCFMFHPKSFDLTEFSVFSDVIKWSTNAVDLFAGKNEIFLQENSLKLTIESCAFEVFAKSLESQLYTQVVSTFKIMFSEHK